MCIKSKKFIDWDWLLRKGNRFCLADKHGPQGVMYLEKLCNEKNFIDLSKCRMERVA